MAPVQVIPAIGAADPRRFTSARRHPLLPVLVAISLGIVIDRAGVLSAQAWWLAALVTLAVWAIVRRGRREKLGALCLIVSLVATGAAWHHMRWSLYSTDELGRFARDEPQPVCLEARALGNPRRMQAPGPNPLSAIPHGDRTRLLVEASRLRDGNRWLPASGRAWLTLDGHLLGVHAGDELRIFAQLVRIAEPRNPGEFDYVAHARADRIFCRLWAEGPASVEVRARPKFSLLRSLEDVRSRGDQLVARSVAPRYAPLAAALMLGSREQLDPEQADDFFCTGMVHVLSISGLHVGILAMGLMMVLRLGLMRRGVALAGVAVLTVGYALIIHAEAPAVRATIIVLVACAAMACGRQALGFNALAAAALLVLALNPADLFRAGPQLSFLCAIVLAWHANRTRSPEPDPLDHILSPTWWDRLVYGFRCGERAIVEGLTLSMCIWFLVLPLVAYQFHLISPVALVLTTILAIPIVGALLSGFALLVVGWLFPPATALFATICGALLAIVDKTIEIGARIPGGHWWTIGPPAWWVAGFYVLVLPFLVAPWLRWQRRKVAWLVGAWCTVVVVLPQPRAHDRLTATVLSVGHGCAVVLELPNGKTMLYDAGSLASGEGAAQSISCFLWTRHIGHLDSVIVSHADVDHFNALPELLQRIRIDRVLMSPAMLEAPRDRALDALFAAVRRAGVPIETVAAPTTLDIDADVQLRVLHPPVEGCGGNDNAQSIVLAVETAGRRLLLPGDLEGAGMQMLMSQPAWDCDILLAPHHGSIRSDPPGFAAWSAPEFVILSGATRHHPTAAGSYEVAGGRTLSTADDGAITVEMGREGVNVRTFFEGR